MVPSLLNDSEHLSLDPEELDDYVKQLAVTMFVDVQKKAQQEIDAVVGLDRLPVMDDRTGLKYIDRLIEEVLRWQPIAPLGGPHACSRDDVYQGYNIPKGTVVFANVWAMTRDTSAYSDPERFDPDRYLDPNVPYAPAFGFGRRMCPGLHYAKASLFLTISSVLAVFNIVLAKDSDGNDQIPELGSSNQVP
ncbi:hypothetical protein FRC09_014391 [Ceratobasidium sp. 395]|nr:hypothetical protein FRC09_014391 [Ceratobasidium sp. 395]